MNLKEFNILQEKYKELKEYKDKNIDLLRSISNDLDVIHCLLSDINDTKLKEQCREQINICWTHLGLLNESLNYKSINVLIQKELTRLENTELTVKPLTLEVRKDD